jgi:outer membrane protein
VASWPQVLADPRYCPKFKAAPATPKWMRTANPRFQLLPAPRLPPSSKTTAPKALFDLGAWHRFQASKTAQSQSDVTFAQEAQRLILRSAEAYFASLRALDELASAKAEEKALEQGLIQTRQRFDVGLTAITEVNEAQAEYDSAKANRLIREGDLVIAFEALEVLTGQTHTQVAPLKDSFPVKPAEPQSRDSWVEMAKTRNTELQIAKLQYQAAQSAYKAARAGHLPTLSAGIGYSDSETRGEPALNQRASEGTQANITLRIPIYSGGRISAERQQAAFQQVSAQEAVTLTERQITQATRSQFQRVDTGVSTVQARKQAIISSESALAAVKAGYEVGTRNWVNVLDAQKRVYAAKRNYSAALYDYVLASLALKQSAGNLTEADIALLDQWLNKSQPVGLTAGQPG